VFVKQEYCTSYPVDMHSQYALPCYRWSTPSWRLQPLTHVDDSYYYGDVLPQVQALGAAVAVEAAGRTLGTRFHC